jgi:hypothetical protein
LDIEKGDVVRALARYNGSLGKFDYPNTVLGFLERQWRWSPPKIGVPAPEATVPATAVAPVKP